jgi:hypothetical protein
VSDRQPKQNIDTAFVVLVCCGFYGTRLEIAFHPLRQSHHGTTQPSCEVEYGEQNGRWAVLLHRVPGHILSLVNTVACRVRWIRCDPARLRFDASCGQLEAYIIHYKSFRQTSFPFNIIPRTTPSHAIGFVMVVRSEPACQPPSKARLQSRSRCSTRLQD